MCGNMNNFYSIIYLLGEEPVKLSIEVPRQRFWLTFTFLLETIKIPTINPNKDILTELNFQKQSVTSSNVMRK